MPAGPRAPLWLPILCTIQAQSCLTSMSIKSKELLLSATISLLYPSLELWRQSSSKAIGCNQTTTLLGRLFLAQILNDRKNRPDDSVFVFPSVSSDRKERERKKGERQFPGLIDCDETNAWRCCWKMRKDAAEANICSTQCEAMAWRRNLRETRFCFIYSAIGRVSDMSSKSYISVI